MVFVQGERCLNRTAWEGLPGKGSGEPRPEGSGEAISRVAVYTLLSTVLAHRTHYRSAGSTLVEK